MPENKKHHYVPKFYLKRFSADGKSISIYNVPTSKRIPNGNLGNQCYKDYFYGKDQIVEKSLGSMEGAASAIFKRIADNTARPIDEGDFPDLILYIAMQHGRTAYEANAMDEITDALFKYLKADQLRKIGVDPNNWRLVSTEPGKSSASFSAMSHTLLSDLSLKLVRIRDQGEFITSDAPVVYYNQLFEDDRHGSNAAVASKGLQIFFPIDTKNLLMLYDREVYGVGGRSNKIITGVTKEDINQLNALQMISADENVYYRDRNFSITELFNRYSKFRRKTKSSMKVFPEKTEGELRSEILATSRTDVKLGLNLSFVKSLKSARTWKHQMDKETSRPAVLVRNEEAVEFHRRTVEDLRSQKISKETFVKAQAHLSMALRESNPDR